MAILFYARDRNFIHYNPKKDKPKLVLVREKGEHFQITANDSVELFPIRVLAKAMDRQTTTIRLWEEKYGFPKPMFVLKTRIGKRFYSGEQILNIHNLILTKYEGRKYFQDKESFDAFMADVKSVFYERSIVVKGEGRFDVE